MEADKGIDVFAFAMTVYEMITGITPWKGCDKKEIHDKVAAGGRPEVNDYLIGDFKNHRNLVDVMKNAWDHDLEKRPTFFKIYEALKQYQTK